MNDYWLTEMRRNTARERALMSGPNGDFYRRWKINGSPNSMNVVSPAPALRPVTALPRRPAFPVGVRKTKRPRMTNHAGRTWDKCYVYLPDGTKVDGYLDTTWGSRFYFQARPGGDWYTASMYDFELAGTGSSLVYCLREDRYGVRIGDTVELKESAEAGRAKITGFYDHEGGVMIEPMLDGFRSWNLDALNVVERSRRG